MHPNTVMPFARISASNQSIVSFGSKLLGVVVSPSKWLSFIVLNCWVSSRDFFHFLCKLLRNKVMFSYLEPPVEATIHCSTTGAIIHKPA
jgi:hypothetical protein